MKMTGKRHIMFCRRGNQAIRLSLRYARSFAETLALPDQGGWMTYGQSGVKEGYRIRFIPTDDGLVDVSLLEGLKDVPGVMILNAMPGYHALLDMDAIARWAKQQGVFLINDVSGAIGTGQERFGDLILGSFGRWKPVSIRTGGFLAFDDGPIDGFLSRQDLSHQIDFPALLEQLTSLRPRLERWRMIHDAILKDFRGHVLHPGKGINVIVPFSSAGEKKAILSYCEKHKYPSVLCPKDIRVKRDAVSIEVKRLG